MLVGVGSALVWVYVQEGMAMAGTGSGQAAGLPAPPMMTARQVAALLSVHVNTVLRLTKRGQLPAARVGAQYRYDRRVVEQLIAGGQAGR